MDFSHNLLVVTFGEYAEPTRTVLICLDAAESQGAKSVPKCCRANLVAF